MMIPTIDATILQAILAIPVALVLFACLVVLVMSEWERRNDRGAKSSGIMRRVQHGEKKFSVQSYLLTIHPPIAQQQGNNQFSQLVAGRCSISRDRNGELIPRKTAKSQPCRYHHLGCH